MDRKKLAAVLAALATVFTLLGTLIDPGSQRTVTVPKTAPPAPAVAPTGPPAGELATKDPADLRTDRPADVPAQVLDQAQATEEKAATTLPAPDSPLPVAGAQGFSCRTQYASRGYGDRQAGSKVMSIKFHFTVSANVPGWADVLGVRAYLEREGLSAHDIMDFEGHCVHAVPYAKKAYTEGAFNSTSDSIEIIATGRETRAQWLAAPLFKQGILASWARDRLTARGLPRRFVDPVGCVDLLGYTDHNHLECGNDHVDVSPICARTVLANPTINSHPFGPPGCTGFPWDVLASQLADLPGAVTITDRVTCRKLNWWRTHGRPHGGKAEANAIRRRHALDARGVTCTAKGPVRR